MLRTALAACLHRLSTDLCTARLDAVRHPQKTVVTLRYNGSGRKRRQWFERRASCCRLGEGGGVR